MIPTISLLAGPRDTVPLVRIQLRLFRDPDPIHFIEALLEIIKKLR